MRYEIETEIADILLTSFLLHGMVTTISDEAVKSEITNFLLTPFIFPWMTPSQDEINYHTWFTGSTLDYVGHLTKHTCYRGHN